MNLRRILLTMLGLYVAGTDAERHYASPTKAPTKKPTFGPTIAFYKIPVAEVNRIVYKTNYARRNVSPRAARMHKVSWNYSMQKDLESYVQITPKSFWFSSDTPGVKFNALNLMEREPFKTNYPNWGYLIHDGCQSTNNGVANIFQMRAVAQRPYFEYYNCDSRGVTYRPGYTNNYTSCAAEDYPKVSNKPYSWVWQYLPPLLLENTTEIACMLLSQSGPNAAGGFRPNHFFCYRNNVTPQINEVPYKAGKKSGIECPGKVVDRLCI